MTGYVESAEQLNHRASSSMHCHANARLAPRGRATVFELVEAGMTDTAACLAARVSRRFYHRRLPRWRADGAAGLVDRSSRPRSAPHPFSLVHEAQVVGLRERFGWDHDRIGALLGLPASTVHRVLRRHALVGQNREPVPVGRYEHQEAGGLVHLDTKNLGRIVGVRGHRASGDRRDHPARGRLGGRPRRDRRCHPIYNHFGRGRWRTAAGRMGPALARWWHRRHRSCSLILTLIATSAGD